MTTVFLVDDHEVVRRGVADLLGAHDDLEVVGDAGSVAEALARIPALAPEVAAKIAGERPDLVKLGEFAGAYGFVMTGATSANALAVYELQAKEFTGYWSGAQDLDTTLANTAAGMAELLK